jgi:hypothetical protein
MRVRIRRFGGLSLTREPIAEVRPSRSKLLSRTPYSPPFTLLGEDRPGRLLDPQSRFRDRRQISGGKFGYFPRATAGSTGSAFDGSGLRGHWPTRPAPPAFHPVLVRRLALLLHASFRPSLASSLCASLSFTPSGWDGDLHLASRRTCLHTNFASGLRPGDVTARRAVTSVQSSVSSVQRFSVQRWGPSTPPESRGC